MAVLDACGILALQEPLSGLAGSTTLACYMPRQLNKVEAMMEPRMGIGMSDIWELSWPLSISRFESTR